MELLEGPLLKPLVFIGSSVEGLALGNAIQQGLQRHTFPKVWTQGVFGPASITIDALLEHVAQNDFGVFIVTPDDVARIRAANYHVARDNVLLEGSLFMGRYGRERVFLVRPMGVPDFHIPTDLLGMTFAEYDPAHARVDVRAAVGPACTEIVDAISRVPNYESDLDFAISLRRGGQNYPAKVWAEITNYGARDVVLRANYFKYKPTLRRAPNAIPVGNPAKQEFRFNFPGHGTHDQLTYLLRPRQKTSVWVGVDPTHTDAEINGAITAIQVAELHMTCSWLSEKDVTMRNYVKEI
jgi:hypothetical protein